MAFEKILVLESTWANDSDDYIRDSRSTARIYLSFESLLSLHDVPVFGSNGGADGIVNRLLKKTEEKPLNSRVCCHLLIFPMSLRNP